MYTSNFARIRSLPPDLEPVAVSRGLPGWYKGRRELRLTPTRFMLRQSLEVFNQYYADLLRPLDPCELYAELGDNAVLICWEPPNICCHRRWIAEWFEETLNLVVPEFGFPRSEILRYEEMPLKKRR